MRVEELLYNSKIKKSSENSKVDAVNSIAQKYIAAAGVQAPAVKSNDSGITTATDTKKAAAYKPEDNPIIRALGAGDYGASKNTRTDKVLKGASQSTASSLVNALGTVSGGTGELTMGQSAQAAVKGQKQQKLETEKKQRQNAVVQQKLYNKADELSAKSEKNIAEAKEGLGKVGQTLVDVGVAGTQMLGDAVLNLAAPGAGLIGMGLRSFGSGAQEQRQKGGTETDMLLGGLKSAAIEVFTERLGGFYGKSKLNGVIDDAIKSIGKSGAMPALLTLVKNGAEEAVEEILSDIFNPLADRVLDLDNKRGSGEKIGVFSEDNVKTMIHDGIVGGVLGLVGGGGQVVGNAVENTQTAQDAAETPTAEEQQTTPTADANAVTEAQEKLNSALQNDETQTAANPIIEAIQNAQQQNSAEQQTDGNPETHIDNRNMADVGSRSVHSFQYEHPELHDYFVEAAEALKEDVGFSAWTETVRPGKGTVNAKSEALETLMRMGISRPQIDKALDDIIKNHGAEDYAVAKRVELVLDDMLSHGYVPAENTRKAMGNLDRVPPNEAYLNAKAQIAGSSSNDALTYKVERAIQNTIEAAQFDNENLTREQALAEVRAYPEINGLTQEEIEKYISGLGAANINFTAGDMTEGQRWVADAQNEGESAVQPISNEQMSEVVSRGEMPQDVPRADLNGHLTSKTVSTVVNSGVTPQAMSEAIIEDAAQGRFSRIAYTDEAALQTAESEIAAVGWEKALAVYENDVAKGIGGKDMAVKGIVLYNNAVNSGDFATAMDILSLMVKVSTSNAQGVQAMRILNKLSPDSRLYLAFKSAEQITREIKAKYNLDTEIEIDSDLMRDYRDALMNGDNAAIREAWEKVEQNIADQMPSNWRDKLNAWRYLSMLGNPRTHIRNIVGNAGFVPVRVIKNVMAAGIESAVNAVGGSVERTKAFINPAAAAKVIGSAMGDWGGGIRQNRTGGEKGNTERVVSLSRDSDGDVALVATAWMDYINAYEAIMAGGKYNDPQSGINDKRTIFGFEPLEKMRRFDTNALNAEDSWFSQPAYAFSLASWLKANGFSATDYADGGMSETDMAKAREYAIKEAQKATYRDTNKFSEFISSLGKTKFKTVNALVEGVLPFKKTPANILARAVEYSPVGIGIELAEVAKGNRTAAEFIDGLSAGLTGTGILALGVWLAAQGLLSGGASDDDKQDEFDELQGKQSYALDVGGKSITLDWLAPEALPLFVGVELFNNLGDGKSPWDLIDALGNISQPLFDMSMLQGVNDLIDTIGYAKRPVWAIMTNAALGYISQFIPTIFGQIERVTEGTRQSTFIDKASEIPSDIQYAVGKALNKLPGEYNQMDYIDAWGRTQSTGNAAQRVVNNFLNPAYVSDKRTTEVETELQRLYDAGYGDVLPSGTSYSTKVEGEYLTKEQYVKYATKKGQTSLALVEKLMGMSAYSKMSDAAKNDAIKDIYDYATDEAKRAVNPKAEVPTWHDEAKASGNAAKYIADRAAYDDAAGGKTGLAGLVEAAENGASEDILLANMSDAAKDAYASAKAGGASIENFANAYNYYYNEAKGDDKQMQVINYCYSVGKSPAEREALFNALYPKYKGKPIDWS